MIVRILNEGQYVVPSLYYDDLNKIDNEIVKFIAKDDEKEFHKAYKELIEIIRKNGVPMDSKTLQESDLIVPPADLTFKEAKRIFVGEGLIPG